MKVGGAYLSVLDRRNDGAGRLNACAAPLSRGYATGARSGPLCQDALDEKMDTFGSTAHLLRVAGSGL